MRTRVATLGGSLLRPEVEDRHEWLIELCKAVNDVISSGYKLALVIGGGAPAREGIELAKPILNANTEALDRIGIAATRLNATIVAEALIEAGNDVAPLIPINIQDAVEYSENHAIVVMGGTEPGHTTDTVAIQLAKELGAECCIIATNVGHVYSSDPRKNEHAKKFRKMTHQELLEIVGPAEHRNAGRSAVIDPIGASIAKEAQMNLAVLDGRDIERLRAALNGESFEGTNVEG
tara:strand:+ start:67 stop:771 length:705 start_codon:yes stop_codon:yes gene_type:complete